jgi:hypothetical protein
MVVERQYWKKTSKNVMERGTKAKERKAKKQLGRYEENDVKDRDRQRKTVKSFKFCLMEDYKSAGLFNGLTHLNFNSNAQIFKYRFTRCNVQSFNFIFSVVVYANRISRNAWGSQLKCLFRSLPQQHRIHT